MFLNSFLSIQNRSHLQNIIKTTSNWLFRHNKLIIFYDIIQKPKISENFIVKIVALHPYFPTFKGVTGDFPIFESTLRPRRQGDKKEAPQVQRL